MRSDQVKIREASPTDASVVAGLIVRFFRDEGFDSSEDDLRSRVQPFLADPANTILIAWSSEAAVGLATITTTFGFEVGRYAEIEDLYVLPEHRGQGCASQLIEAAALWCRARGCAELEVVVTPAGERAHGLTRFYAVRGFVSTGRTILARTL
jgi:GNAT superfamily N-acetyltransferase